MSTTKTVHELIDKVDFKALMSRPLSDWRPVLARECQVYVFGENYLAKRFDQINYKFCEKMEAKEILIDNLYALLRYRYFPSSSEEVDDRINKIIASFTANLKTTLRRVSFDFAADCDIMHQLPDYCIAFRNGVYDFKNNKWFLKYDVIDLKRISNKIYIYRNDYAIMWYFNYDFEPLPINVMSQSVEEFVDMMKIVTKEEATKNYCFELLYNISHDEDDKFSMLKFKHLCEILGYSILQSFSQYFVMLIGSGQNGKNSLFDGCVIHRLVPRPASNDLDEIENDRFITSSLENKAQNFFLETSAKTYTESKMIKALTGSMYQTIQPKGINKYSGVINCKYIFAGNDQEKIKFSDNTTGFRRRINMFEIYYRWDAYKRFMKRGDYYDTSFSDSLKELKDDTANTTAYIYFAMYGIYNATRGFTSNFAFSKNDWNTKYSDSDVELKEKIELITPDRLAGYFGATAATREEAKSAIYLSPEKERLYSSKIMRDLGYGTVERMINMLEDEEAYNAFFAEHDIYISLRTLQNVLKDFRTPNSFTQAIKKIYTDIKFESCCSNKPYIKCTFIGKRIRILT